MAPSCGGTLSLRGSLVAIGQRDSSSGPVVAGWFTVSLSRLSGRNRAPGCFVQIGRGWVLLGEEFPAPVLHQFSAQKGHFGRHLIGGKRGCPCKLGQKRSQ